MHTLKTRMRSLTYRCMHIQFSKTGYCKTLYIVKPYMAAYRWIN